MGLTLIIVLALASIAAGGLTVGYLRRGRSHRRWKVALFEAAKRLPGARASQGTRYDGPELRVDIDGRTVSLGVRDEPGAPDRGEARASVALGDGAPSARLWLGWDVDSAPPDWAHVEVVALEAQRVDGPISSRSDDAAFAQRVLDATYLDLLDVRREAQAHGVTLAVRGGYLELRVFGIATSSHFLERLVRATARIALVVQDAARGTRLEG